MAVGVWSDGRIGTMRGIRDGQSDFGAVVICEKSIQNLPRDAKSPLYAGLIAEKILETGGVVVSDASLHHMKHPARPPAESVDTREHL